MGERYRKEPYGTRKLDATLASAMKNMEKNKIYLFHFVSILVVVRDENVSTKQSEISLIS